MIFRKFGKPKISNENPDNDVRRTENTPERHALESVSEVKPSWCEALSFRIASGGQHWKTGGSSTLYGLDPFGPIFLPLKERSRSHSGMGLSWFLTIFRMAFTIFLWRDRKCGLGAPYWSLFGGHHDRKHKNEHEEAAQAQPNKNICKNKTTCQFSNWSVD